MQKLNMWLTRKLYKWKKAREKGVLSPKLIIHNGENMKNTKQSV